MAVDKCGNCAFHTNSIGKKGQIYCVLGGKMSGPYYSAKTACICYRPSVKEAKKRRSDIENKAISETNKIFNAYYDKRLSSHINIRDTFAWNDELDARLRYLYCDTVNSVSEICSIMGIERPIVGNRIKVLGLSRPSSNYTKSNTRQENVEVPLEKQRFPNIRCCKGMCCKYKERCAHYHHYLEMGKPIGKLINSVSSCISTTENGIAGRYREYLGLDGSKEFDPITFTETC